MAKSNPEGGRYTPEEAMMAQEYATKKEKKGFNERAGEESYAEAERLVQILRDKKFDWLGIDWDKVDFKSIDPAVENRVLAALDIVLSRSKKPGLRLNPGTRKFLPFAVAASWLIAACNALPSVPQEEHEKDRITLDDASRERSTERIRQSVGKILEDARDELASDTAVEYDAPSAMRAAIVNWKIDHPDVSSIIISPALDRELPRARRQGENWVKEVEVTIIARNGKRIKRTKTLTLPGGRLRFHPIENFDRWIITNAVLDVLEDLGSNSAYSEGINQ